MRIIDVPYVWSAYCIQPRFRRPSLVGVIERVPVSLRSTDDQTEAPVVARLVLPGDRLFSSAHVLSSERFGPETTSEIEYRKFDGALWRPVSSSRAVDVVGWIGSDLDSFEEGWRKSLERAVGGRCHRSAYSTDLDRAPYSVPAIEYPAITDDVDFLPREILWNDRDVRREQAVRDAEHSFALIDGNLYCRTPGPAFVVCDNTYTDTRLPGVSVSIDGPASNLVNRPTGMFRPDRFDAAVAYAGYCGLDDRLVGRIEILDPAALSEVLFSEDYFIVRWAAIWLVWNDHVDNLIQAGPIDAHRCRLELREMLTSGADLTEANALARMEHLVRRIHEQLPEYYLTAPNAMTESTAPKHADLRPLDWRREHDAMFPADRPVTFGP